MSAQITNQYPGAIGRMFARQNVPSVYGAQKAAAGVETDEGQGVMDSVSLSAMAPKPLTTGFLEQALSVGRSLGEGTKISSETEDRLREDRVFAAVSALSLLGYGKGDNTMGGWPGGIPAPSREELEAARRRLAQRPSDSGDSANPEAIMNERVELMRKVGKSDLADMAFTMSASATGR